jgi:hypothetical protein
MVGRSKHSIKSSGRGNIMANAQDEVFYFFHFLINFLQTWLQQRKIFARYMAMCTVSTMPMVNNDQTRPASAPSVLIKQ